MKIVVDENVSFGLIDRLKRKGHTVTTFAEIASDDYYHLRSSFKP